MSFKNILGNESAIKKLKALILSGRVPPTLLFSGLEGTGKFLTARKFAMALNCTHTPQNEPKNDDELFGAEPELSSAPAGEPGDSCGLCVSCSQIDKGVHPDVRIIDAQFQGLLMDEEAQKQKTLRIDTVREFTRYVYQRSVFSKWKVFIVNDAHTLNINAQNAMLKVLEEPPANTVFILVAARKNLLLPTIISRSYAIEFSGLSPAAVEEILEKGGMTIAEASALGARSGGSVKKARDIKKVRDRLSAIPGSGPQKIFKLTSTLPREPYMAREEAKIMLDMLLTSARRNWLDRISSGEASGHAELIRKLLQYRRLLNQNVSHGLILEAALLESGKLSLSLD